MVGCYGNSSLCIQYFELFWVYTVRKRNRKRSTYVGKNSRQKSTHLLSEITEKHMVLLVVLNSPFTDFQFKQFEMSLKKQLWNLVVFRVYIYDGVHFQCTACHKLQSNTSAGALSFNKTEEVTMKVSCFKKKNINSFVILENDKNAVLLSQFLVNLQFKFERTLTKTMEQPYEQEQHVRKFLYKSLLNLTWF